MTLQSVLPPAAAEVTTNVASGDANVTPEVVDPSVPPQGPAAEEPKVDAVADESFAQKLALIARRDRELRTRENRLKDQMAQLEQLKDPKYLEYLEAKKSKNPIKTWEALGYTFEEATQFVLNDQKPTQEKIVADLQQQLAELNEKLAAKEAGEKDQADATIIQRAKHDLKAYIDDAGDTYELIRENNAYGEVWDVIEGYYEQHGKILPHEEACQHVEKYFEDYVTKMKGLKKFAAKPPEANADNGSSGQKIIEPPKTLTNKLNSTQSPSEAPQEYLSDEDSKARSAEFLRQELAKRKALLEKVAP